MTGTVSPFGLRDLISSLSYLGYCVLFCMNSSVVQTVYYMPNKTEFLLHISVKPLQKCDIILAIWGGSTQPRPVRIGTLNPIPCVERETCSLV